MTTPGEQPSPEEQDELETGYDEDGIPGKIGGEPSGGNGEAATTYPGEPEGTGEEADKSDG